MNETIASPITAASRMQSVASNSGNAMVGIEMDSPDTNLADIALTQPQNAILLAGYATAALIAGTVVLHRTEAR